MKGLPTWKECLPSIDLRLYKIYIIFPGMEGLVGHGRTHLDASKMVLWLGVKFITDTQIQITLRFI